MIFGSMSMVITAFTFVVIVTSCSSVSANHLRVVFNYGNAPGPSTSCTEGENIEIDNVMKNFQPILRRLQDISINETSFIDQNQKASFVDANANATAFDRELFPAYCRDVCAGCVPKTCRSARCVGFRRNRALDYGSNDISDRNLLVTGSCSSLINPVHNAYDALMGRLSPTCRNFITRNTRNVQCVPNGVYGGITGLKAWTTRVPQSIISSGIPQSGWSVCRSHSMITLEAIVNECVYDVRFVLNGPGGYQQNWDTWAPFQTTVWVTFTGLYTLTMTPNNMPGNAKAWTYTVTNC